MSSFSPMTLRWRRILEHELALLAALEQLEAQPLPVRREPRCSGDALIRQAHATEAKHDSLPHRSSRRAVDAVLGVQAQVFEVQQRRLHIEMIRQLRVSHATREDRLDAGRQRRAVGEVGTRGVVVPVGPDRRLVKFVWQQIEQHQDIGLLEHLRLIGRLDAQERLH